MDVNGCGASMDALDWGRSGVGGKTGWRRPPAMARGTCHVARRREECDAMAALERAVVVVLDGVGAGQAPDAAAFGDAGANCLTNTAHAVGQMALPMMGSMGIGNLTPIAGTPPTAHAIGAYGLLDEVSPAKDSTTGHWELMGVTLDRPMPTYPHGFPPELVARFETAIGRGTLGNRPASGTEIIK